MMQLQWALHKRRNWCLARRQGKGEFGDTAASAADHNGYRLVNGDPLGVRDDHRGRYSVSQRGHPLVGTVQLLQL